VSTPIIVSLDGMLLNWVKKIGDSVQQGDVVAEVEADKATVEIEAPSTGIVISQSVAVGSNVTKGSSIGVLGASAEISAPAQPVQASVPVPVVSAPVSTVSAPASVSAITDDGRIKASPIARKIADARGIDLLQIAGTGPGGRIVKEDVENFTPVAPAKPTVSNQSSTISAPIHRALPEGTDVELIDVTSMRKRIVAVTQESKQQIPHFYVTTVVNVDPLLLLRKQINQSLSDDAKISVNDLIVKATALTLRQFPNLNTHFYGDKLVRHKRIHIGIAVALPNGGLINVVARDADRVALGTLAVQNKEMFARARDGKIKPEDIGGATFTVSNLGAYDVDQFAAIINPPESGILAISTAQKVPVVNADGSLGVGMRMKVTISVDHRVSDGAEGAQFLQAFKSLLETPLRLLI